MEQKQLDEIDDAFFGEEFVDEESPLERPISSKEERKQPLVTKPKQKIVKKEEKEEKDDDFITIKPIKAETKSEMKTINQKSVSSSKNSIETESPVNPWAEEGKKVVTDKSEPGFFEDITTWKAITGIVVVLLIFSILTQGFEFANATLPVASLTLNDAKQKTLNYVNNNLLRPPYTAEIKNAQDLNNVYKITLSIAGQELDSYLTKDGQFFFPQGLNTSISLAETALTGNEKPKQVSTGTQKTASTSGLAVNSSTTSLKSKKEAVPDTQKTTEGATVTTSSVPSVTAAPEKTVSPTKATPSSSGQKKIILTAKRWHFSPEKIIVNKGDKVILTIQPENLDFTFSIPTLGVTEAIKSITTIEFTAQETGTYQFSCSSCEDYRNMVGTLYVE